MASYNILTKDSGAQNQTIQNYYNFQSTIYDSTRWTFLFGRKLILDKIAEHTSPKIILEIGCGTGYNLRKLSKRFPNAQIIGMDVSKDMLQIAQKKLERHPNIQLIERPYGKDSLPFMQEQPDVILFSYMLTMVNPGFSDMIFQAYHDLKPEGHIAVVDFYNSKHSWFRKHMSNHHVRMESHINPILNKEFDVVSEGVHTAYRGVWQYFTFIGKKAWG